MTSIKTLAALAAGLAVAVSSHAATYSFTGNYGEAWPDGSFTATFSLTVPVAITADTVIAASAMAQCRTPVSQCVSATFYMDAAAAGIADHHDWEAIALANEDSISYYYFEAPAFGTDGVYTSVEGIGPATLEVSTAATVPEPAAASLALAGLGLLGLALRRRGVR